MTPFAADSLVDDLAPIPDPRHPPADLLSPPQRSLREQFVVFLVQRTTRRGDGMPRFLFTRLVLRFTLKRQQIRQQIVEIALRDLVGEVARHRRYLGRAAFLYSVF